MQSMATATAPDIVYRRPKLTSIDYLHARQQFGTSSRGMHRGQWHKIQANQMAAVMAWNPARLQNMSLCVGPGSPASVIMSQSMEEAVSDEEDINSHNSDESSESSDQSLTWQVQEEDGDVMEAMDDNDGHSSGISGDDDDDELDEDRSNENVVTARDLSREQQQQPPHSPARARSTRGSPQVSPRSRFVRSTDAALRQEAYRILQRRLREEAEAVAEGSRSMRSSPMSSTPESTTEPPLERVRRRLRSRELVSSIRHGGCINTACWLDVPWRFSLVNERSGILRSPVVESYETPTQMITSGDDRLLKVWDCAGAMGMDNPLPGGWNTFSPFCMQPPSDDNAFVQDWKSYFAKRADYSIGVSGTTRKLKAMATGHRGNVFHVTPLKYGPGKFVTCAADGYVRLVDTVADRSSVVSHPLLDSESGEDMFRIRSYMAYSHVMMTADTGLICSERGLHRFDLRLSPREQPKKSLLQDLVDDETSWRTYACKACAIWRPHGDLNDDVESSYVFAGGSSESVGLFDLRMDASRGRIIQRYRPKLLKAGESHVSVSGLDISKDSRELLVSFESDQIYTFPILQNGSSAAGPTMEDIDLASMHHECSNQHAIQELASYGGHLNRFTFLKNAKYAGPNDEYICTGSDSGHAWIYERKTGTVVSLLGADRSTCNGAVPHPSLPFFLTYGIESTAKLWRASNPIDGRADDSAAGRRRCHLLRKHELSPVARMWDGVQSLLRHFEPLTGVLPDYIASSEEMTAGGRFGSPTRRGMCGPNTPKIGNSLLELPSILRQNQYECLHAFVRDLDVPVEQPVIDFIHHVSISRLKFQADRIGTSWNPFAPYILGNEKVCDDRFHQSELIPDFPSDWLSFDRRTVAYVHCPRRLFDLERNFELVGRMIPGFFDLLGQGDKCIPWLNHAESQAVDEGDTHAYEGNSRRLIYATALLCKEGGNVALKLGLLQAAARRYDKALQYLALSLMHYGGGDEFLWGHLMRPYRIIADTDKKDSKTYLSWSEPLKLLLMCRLNLSLLYLKPEMSSPDQAAIQARAALRLLGPFCAIEGKIRATSESSGFVKENESPTTYKEAKALQAKAFFRLGSAALETGDFGVAVKSFESSLAASKAIDTAKPDPATVRLLLDARRRYNAKKKRAREKNHRMLDSEAESNSDDPHDAVTSSPERQTEASSSAVTPDSASG